MSKKQEETVDSMLDTMGSLSEACRAAGEAVGAFEKLARDLRKVKKNLDQQFYDGKKKSA